jgi:hypothetical protein
VAPIPLPPAVTIATFIGQLPNLSWDNGPQNRRVAQ